MKSSPSPGSERESRRGNRASSDAGVNDSATDRGTFAAGAVRAQDDHVLVECQGCHCLYQRDGLCDECGGCFVNCCLCNVPNSDEDYDEIVRARGA